MAKQLLIEQDGEFYPVAGSINKDGTFNYLHLHNGDDFANSDALIGDFKKLFKERLAAKTIRAYAIAYDVRVTTQKYPDKIDAIAVFVKHDGEQPINYFYPYSLKIAKIEFFESWGEYVNEAK